MENSIIKKYLDKNVETHPFTMMDQGIIFMEASYDTYTITLDKDMDKSDREEFIKAIHKEL